MKNGNPSGASEFLVDGWGKEHHQDWQMSQQAPVIWYRTSKYSTEVTEVEVYGESEKMVTIKMWGRTGKALKHSSHEDHWKTRGEALACIRGRLNGRIKYLGKEIERLTHDLNSLPQC